jgi:hypothetical protein
MGAFGAVGARPASSQDFRLGRPGRIARREPKENDTQANAEATVR